MRTLGPNAKATIIYGQIIKLQKELFEALKKQGVFVRFEKDLAVLLKKQKLDLETFEALKRFMKKEPVTIDAQTKRCVVGFGIVFPEKCPLKMKLNGHKRALMTNLD